jgi:hypothetical protein
LFLDGAEYGSGTAASGAITYPVGDLFIGSFDAAGSYGWPGVLDEVEIYNRALSADELAAIYHAGALGKCVSQSLPALGGSTEVAEGVSRR